MFAFHKHKIHELINIIIIIVNLLLRGNMITYVEWTLKRCVHKLIISAKSFEFITALFWYCLCCLWYPRS